MKDDETLLWLLGPECGMNKYLSILRAGFGAGRKNPGYFGPKILAHNRPTGQFGPHFSGQARARSGPGQAARTFCSVK